MVGTVEDGSLHASHFRYNRRLACFSNAVSAVVCSRDGRWIVCGTGSGDVKVWDASVWAEVARLKGFCSKMPNTLTFSPAMRWLVCAYDQALYVFDIEGKWQLHHVLPAQHAGASGGVSSWICVAFASTQEVNHAVGATGHNAHLACLSETHLEVLDYSGGWKKGMPSRSRSLSVSAGVPTCMTYTSCGTWVACGFESGQVQVWNASSLSVEKALSGHDGVINSLTSSPDSASYDVRVASCCKDQSIRLWNPVLGSWVVESQVREPRSGPEGCNHLSFASDGKWLASVGMVLCIWRVIVDAFGSSVTLEAHQYIEVVSGSEALRCACFSASSAIVSGSQEGMLDMWMEADGRPTEDRRAAVAKAEVGVAPLSAKVFSPKPMKRLCPQGNFLQPGVEQFAPMSATVGTINPMELQSGAWRRHSLVTAGMLSVSPGTAPRRTSSSSSEMRSTITGSSSQASLRSWSNNTMRTTPDGFAASASTMSPSPSSGMSGRPSDLSVSSARQGVDVSDLQGGDRAQQKAPVRTMTRTSSLIVKRISLQPELITS